MILDELTLHNFGLYAGRQTVELTPPAPDKPVILFGGLNGGGKTTLLDAIQLCLFGPHATISNRGTLSYPEYLSRSIHRGADLPEAAIEIAFRHTVEGAEDQYRLHRSWRRSGGTCKEHFQVLKNGKPEPALADNWASQVDDFIPANIAHLFLFDGEQIEGYASQSDSSHLIGAAIHNLLGLDMVDQLEKDLHVYQRRKRLEAKDSKERAAVDEAGAALREIKKHSEELQQERASLRTYYLKAAEEEFAKAEEEYRNLGGHLYEEREKVERRFREARQKADEGAALLKELAAGALPLQCVRTLLETASKRDAAEEESRRARDLIEVLHQRDKATVKHMRTKKADAEIIKTLKDYLDDDRASQEALARRDTLLDLHPEGRSDLHALLQGDLDDVLNGAHRALKEQKQREATVERTRLEYENVPSEDAIANAAAKRDELKVRVSQIEVQIAALTQEIERLARDIERREASYTRLLEAEAQHKGADDDRARILTHAEKVRGTLSQFRKAVVERHVRRIEQLVLESYQQLLRKASLVTRLSIDPESFSLTLYGRDGHQLTAERLSAGERQLLAIALLWGLAKASGRPLPTAIDTPLGRLDTGHRMHLVERYLPYASHQVLLLSTDEEIEGEYLDMLKPWVGRTYQLAYDDARGETRIVEGYFEAREAA